MNQNKIESIFLSGLCTLYYNEIMETDPNTAKPPCQIFLGTSGYSFPEWLDAGFYPPGTAGKEIPSFPN